MDRKELHKRLSTSSTVANIRGRRREEEIVLRKQKRENVVLSKRPRYEEDTAITDSTFTNKQVENIGHRINIQSNGCLSLLKQLKNAFAEDITHIDTFLSIHGAFQNLIHLLTGSDPDIQLEASWCMTNIAAGNVDHSSLVLKHAAPYLITFLQGHSTSIQDQCCWALGNIASDGPELRDILIKQGAIHPLIQLLQSAVPRVVQSAAFAISNFIRGPDADISILINAGISPLLLQHVNAEWDNLPILAEIAWVLMYAMASGEYEEEFISQDALPKIVNVISMLASSDVQYIQVLTPLIRCLANLCSGPTQNTKIVIQDGCLLMSFPYLISSTYSHIRKESLWLLSNILVDVNVCRFVAKIPDLISYIVQSCEETFDIQKEALVCLCNLAYSGGESCQELFQHGAIQAIIPFLKSPDPELLTCVLNFATMMLMYFEMTKLKLEEGGCIDDLESLCNHNNHTVQDLSYQIFNKYFKNSDDMELH